MADESQNQPGDNAPNDGQQNTGLKGKRVWWEKRGLGKGETAQGKVLREVQQDTTNREAMDAVKVEFKYEYIFRKSYEKFDPDTYKSERVIVAVKQESDRARTLYHFYAPNILDVVPV